MHICLDSKSDSPSLSEGSKATTVTSSAVQETEGDSLQQAAPKSSKAAENRYTFIGQLSVNEKLTVLQLKQLLFDLLTGKQKAALNSVDDGCGWENIHLSTPPQSLHHLRLKDFSRGKLSGPLRDDRQLFKCLPVIIPF